MESTEKSFRLSPQLTLNLGFVAIVTVFSVALLSPVIQDLFSRVDYRVGMVASETVRSGRDFVIDDEGETAIKRAQAAVRVKRVFFLDDRPSQRPSTRAQVLEEELRQLKKDSALEQERVEKKLELDLSDVEWGILAKERDLQSAFAEAVQLAEPEAVRGVILNKKPLGLALERGGAVLQRRSSSEESVITSLDSISDLAEARDAMEASLSSELLSRGEQFSSLVMKLAFYLLRPNIFLDTVETERRILEAQGEVTPIALQIRRGDVILRAGQEITPLQLKKLTRERELRSGLGGLRAAAGYAVLGAAVTGGVLAFLVSFFPGFRPKRADLLLVASVLIGSFLLLRLFLVLDDALHIASPHLAPWAFALATPVAAGGLLLKVTVGAPFVLLYLLIFGVLGAIFLENSLLLALLILVGNIVGALSVRSCPRRSIFLRAAFRIGVTNLILTLAFLILFPHLSVTLGGEQLVAAFCGGLLSGVFAAALAPIAETLGGYVTEIKLLELASLDRPLLRELSIQAPGTWNHSMVIGQLAETAAEAIGAKPLLARVGAYYHDIGKAKKPAYFVENQTSKENRHDKLAPSMSALIIRSHVKDGIEMAEAEKLPQVLIDFIPQHHGTALIEYFYDKAVKEAEEGVEIDDSLYRYPGPKPQTKEAGILMLADGIEAASRTLPDPTPARIQGMVQKIVNKVFSSGQLDQCELTLRDLHLIAKSFTRVLTGIFHRRIAYTESAEKGSERKAHGEETHEESKHAGRNHHPGTDQRAPTENPHEGEDPAASGEALKRLGIER